MTVADISAHLAYLPLDKQMYLLRTLPLHLADAGQLTRLRQVLTNYSFLTAKLNALGFQSLVGDYTYALAGNPPSTPGEADENAGLSAIQSALQLAAHVLV